eukprot:TRINITY_DN14009_c0_g1_i3.p1 TRINITY_DN14009_c0_g1~~TRINITY_DN14009_c0_g1_i3.p1  ORF type:complete len:403 (+),score=53.21 TRINITY_DN14009_c0_g1_i3:417-1625(+)
MYVYVLTPPTYALSQEVEELREAVRIATEEAHNWRDKAHEQEAIAKSYEEREQVAMQRMEHLEKEVEDFRSSVERSASKTDPWVHAEADTEVSSTRAGSETEQSQSRRGSSESSEMSELKKAVVELRSEVQRQQEELKRGTSPEELNRITLERDTLRQVVAKQREHLAGLSGGRQPAPKSSVKPAGLPPLPPGSPPVAPAARFPEGHESDDGCSTDWGCEQLRSEAPSRTSGADTPSLPVSAGHSISPSVGHSISPILRHSSEVTSSRRSSRSGGTSGSVRVSESTGSESVPASLSVSPTPSLHGFLPVEAPQPMLATSPRCGHTMPIPHCNTIRPASYASQASARAVQLSRPAYPKSPVKHRTQSPPAARPVARRKQVDPSTVRGNPRDRAYAPLVFSIHP